MNESALTITSLLEGAKTKLPMTEARLLLRFAANIDHVQLVAYPERTVSPQVALRYQDWVERRCVGEPIAYLTGYREFYGLDFWVTPAVLIPRHETELLVDIARQKLSGHASARVLDLGTGSGCIAVAIAMQIPHAQVTAVDASQQALEVATKNIRQHGASVRLMQSDWFSTLGAEKFDLIVANPPYIADHDEHLDLGDVRFEPRSALTAGEDGLDDIRRIVAEAKKFLSPQGLLFLEHGYNQAEAVAAIFNAAGFVNVEQVCDLAGIVRCSGGCVASTVDVTNID